MVAFLIFAWILKRYVWGPFLALLDERREKIASEFDRIESLRAEAERLRADYESRLQKIEQEARERIQEAVAERFGVRLEREVVFLPQDESGA